MEMTIRKDGDSQMDVSLPRGQLTCRAPCARRSLPQVQGVRTWEGGMVHDSKGCLLTKVWSKTQLNPTEEKTHCRPKALDFTCTARNQESRTQRRHLGKR